MLQGQTYDQIAARFRVTKSTVSKSVTDLARELQSIVGVVGIDEDSAPTAHAIRAHGKDYLEALEHFVPLAKPAATTSLPIITQAHIDQLVLHTARHSRCKQRDIALLLMLIHTGARPNEIARLTVADYIDAAGRLRSPSWLPANAASNGIARPLLLYDATVLYWLDAYLAWRIQPRVCHLRCWPDTRLCRIRFSGIPCAQLCPAGLCQQLAQVPSSRRVSGRPAQQPAHGFL